MLGGGAPVDAPLAGVSFAVPADFKGAWDEDLGALVLQSSDGALRAAVWGWSEGTIEDVEAVVGRRLEAAGMRLQPAQRPGRRTPDESRGWWQVVTAEGSGFLHGAIRRGPDGNVVAVAVAGPEEAESRIEATIEAFLASVRLTPPAAAGWRARVEGTVLSHGASDADYSTGGIQGSGASAASATLALCPARRYRYESVRESYVSIEGASASRTSRDAHAGQWWLVADLAGGATLVLETDEGAAYYWPVREQGDTYIVDDRAYRVTGAC